jgi:hypothetical protein
LAADRVNLIREHTDYSGGLVQPVAVDRGVTVRRLERRPGDEQAGDEHNLVVEAEAPGCALVRPFLSSSEATILRSIPKR